MIKSILRVARVQHLDLTWVEGLRKDLLTLMKNLPKVRDYDTGAKLRGAFRIYRDRFNQVFFEEFLNRELKYYEGIPESDTKWLDKKLRKVAWDLYSELSMPLYMPDSYMSEEGRFLEFQSESEAWKSRLQRKAQVFWKTMKESIEYFESAYRKPLQVTLPEVENVTLEGFKLVFKGFDGSEANEESLSTLKEGLKIYRQRAAKVAPVLLAKQLPMECEFKSTVDKGGEYHSSGYLTLYMSSFTNKGPKWAVQVMAHEMGHHIFRNLSADTKQFWHQTVSGDFGDLDLRVLLDSWPEGAWAFEMTEKLGGTDPILALQIDAISHDTSYSNLQTKEDFQKLYDSGVRTLRAPMHPITGYANKNPEEAFCEALALLVAHGPQAVHEKVRWWLRVALPGQIRIASRKHLH
jgi:hypothetical protein